MRRNAARLFFLVASLGCNAPPAAPPGFDAGPRDPRTDAGGEDAAIEGRDAEADSGGLDAGVPQDASSSEAGLPFDGSLPFVDAGPGPDAGPGRDAGPRADAGPPLDAGPTPLDGGPVGFVGTASCPTADLLSVTGLTVAQGRLDGSGNRFTPSCATQLNGEDHHFFWTAPSNGEWTFDTHGSSIDTLIAVVEGDDCQGGLELACGDDTPSSVQSAVTVTLASGQRVRVVVDEYGVLEAGAYHLSIHRDVPAQEASCDDGLDEDRDGVADCGDSDCVGVGAC